MAARDIQIDAIRGFAIFLVVLGHVIFSFVPDDSGHTLMIELGHLIYTFHMPLFFFLSGYLVYGHYNGDLSKWTKKKFMGLIIPYIIFTIISNYFLHGFHPEYIVWNELISKILSFPEPGSAWFLPVLFELLVLLAIIIHFEKGSGVYSAWVFPALFLLFLILLPLTPLYRIKLTYQIIYFMPFIMAGYYINNFNNSIRKFRVIKKKELAYVSGFSLLPILFLLRFEPSINSLIYGSSLITSCYSFSVASSGILFSILFIKLLTGKLAGHIQMFMAICGIYSLEIYLIHLIVLNYLGFYHISLWSGPEMLGVFIGTMAILLITLALSILLSYNKWISRFFFGRWSFPHVFRNEAMIKFKASH